MIDESAIAEELLARRQARRSLIAFTQYTKPDFAPAEHHKRIADALERVERGECRRLMIFAPPRHTKSELASRRFPAWYIGRNPTKQIITATYASDFAEDFGREVRGIIQDETYKALFDTRLAADSTAKGRWHTEEGGIYVAVGAGGPITGRGAHLALIDDPLKNRQDAESEKLRDTLWHWYTSTLRTRLMPGGAIVIICTRWHEDDLAGRLLAAQSEGGEQWEVVSFPALRVEDGEEKALWPEWYPLSELHSIQGTIGPRDWLSLYQQTPTSEQGTFFKREWIRYYTQVPDSMTIYMSGDFAVTEGDGDYTELAVWGVDTMGNIYALDWWHSQASADVWTTALLDRVKRWSPHYFIGETGPIRRAVEPFLRKSMEERRTYVACEWLPHGQANKEANARSFQAMCSVGKVYFPQSMVRISAAQDAEGLWAERVIDQLLRFPSGKHDDAVDTCSLLGRFIDHTWNAPRLPVKKPLVWDAPITMKELHEHAA